MRLFLATALLSTSLLIGKSLPPPKNAVTYELGGGRFGDKLLCYLHAKWISYKYEIPLFYRPFKYSEHLKMHHKEKKYSDAIAKKFSRTITPTYGCVINYNQTSSSTLFMIPYFPENLWEHDPAHPWYYFKVNWEDKGFIEEVRKLIQPLSIKPKIKFPKKMLTVAIHARLGGGFDDWSAMKNAPLKLPPFSYYIDQLKKMRALFPKEPLFVHLFTDDPNPKQLVDKLQANFKNQNIQFSCRETGNSHDSNVIQDFIEMQRFDCLIRPDSNYSILVEKVTDFKVVISPLHFTWVSDRECIIDEVNIAINRHK